MNFKFIRDILRLKKRKNIEYEMDPPHYDSFDPIDDSKFEHNIKQFSDITKNINYNLSNLDEIYNYANKTLENLKKESTADQINAMENIQALGKSLFILVSLVGLLFYKDIRTQICDWPKICLIAREHK